MLTRPSTISSRTECSGGELELNPAPLLLSLIKALLFLFENFELCSLQLAWTAGARSHAELRHPALALGPSHSLQATQDLSSTPPRRIFPRQCLPFVDSPFLLLAVGLPVPPPHLLNFSSRHSQLSSAARQWTTDTLFSGSSRTRRGTLSRRGSRRTSSGREEGRTTSRDCCLKGEGLPQYLLALPLLSLQPSQTRTTVTPSSTTSTPTLRRLALATGLSASTSPSFLPSNSLDANHLRACSPSIRGPRGGLIRRSSRGGAPRG